MKVEIGENILELEYTVNSICDLEEMRKQSVDVLLSKPGMTSVRDLLWAGLIEKKPNITVKQAGAYMNTFLKTSEIKDLLDIISQAIEEAGFLAAQGKKKK
jgi:hypothetical protein